MQSHNMIEQSTLLPSLMTNEKMREHQTVPEILQNLHEPWQKLLEVKTLCFLMVSHA